jgi:hypothetical protein
MRPLDLIALSFATFYLSYAVSSSAGPWRVFEWLRAHLSLGGLTACIVCLSPWFAGLFYVLLLIAPYIVWLFAAAGASVFLFRYTGGSQVV